MDTSVNPTISFPTTGEDPTVSPVILTSDTGSWTDNKTFVARYDVTDQNLQMLNIDVQVAGGKDVAGDTQTSYTATGNFSIDMLNPAVVSVTPNLTTITDANVGSQKFTLTAVYSEAMNTSVNPAISFPTSGEDPTASPATLTFNSGVWSNSTTFVATYDVADQNVTTSNIDVQVSGGKDAAGNAPTSFTAPNNFSINTLSPSVVSVTPNLTSIADADVGTRTLTLTVVYAESLNTTITPTISFPTSGEDPTASPATLTLDSGGWLNSTTFVASYDVADQNLAMPNVDVEVAGAQDTGGHAQTSFTAADNFSIDMQNPTVASVTPNLTTIADANAGSQTFTLTVAFSEAMNTSQNPTLSFPTSGEDPTVSPATLSFDSGNWTNNATYVATYDVADQNATIPAIDVQVAGATDAAGNAASQLCGDRQLQRRHERPDGFQPHAEPEPGQRSHGRERGVHAQGGLRPSDGHVGEPDDQFPDLRRRPDRVAGHADVRFGKLDQQHDLRGHLRRGEPRRGDEWGGRTGFRRKGQNGSTQAAFTATNQFGINTLNPMLVSMTPSLATIADADVGSQKFAVTAVYDRAMNTSIDPTITFGTYGGGVDPTALPATLTFDSGTWSNSTTYVATYDVADQNVVMSSLNASATGAQDTAGNVQTAFGAIHNQSFNIDTSNPTVTSVTASPTTISDATVQTQGFTLTVVFSKAMDVSVQPAITFPTSGEDPTASPATLSFSSGSWSNATTYVATYTVTDQNATLAGVDVEVSGASDANGNAQTAASTTAGVFAVNTRDSAVLSVTPSATTITDADVGSGTFTLTFVYSKPMDSTYTPAISFPTSGKDPTAARPRSPSTRARGPMPRPTWPVTTWRT